MVQSWKNKFSLRQNKSDNELFSKIENNFRNLFDKVDFHDVHKSELKPHILQCYKKLLKPSKNHATDFEHQEKNGILFSRTTNVDDLFTDYFKIVLSKIKESITLKLAGNSSRISSFNNIIENTKFFDPGIKWTGIYFEYPFLASFPLSDPPFWFYKNFVCLRLGPEQIIIFTKSTDMGAAQEVMNFLQGEKETIVKELEDSFYKHMILYAWTIFVPEHTVVYWNNFLKFKI